MDEMNSRIVTESGIVVTEEPVNMAGNRFGQVIRELEIETKLPAGIIEQNLQDAIDECDRLRDRIAALERQLAERA